MRDRVIRGKILRDDLIRDPAGGAYSKENQLIDFLVFSKENYTKQFYMLDEN